MATSKSLYVVSNRAPFHYTLGKTFLKKAKALYIQIHDRIHKTDKIINQKITKRNLHKNLDVYIPQTFDQA